MALVTTIPVSIRIPINPGRESEVLVTTSATIARIKGDDFISKFFRLDIHENFNIFQFLQASLS